MSCPHLPDSHMKCAECATEAVRKWRDSHAESLVQRAKEAGRKLREANRRIHFTPGRDPEE